MILILLLQQFLPGHVSTVILTQLFNIIIGGCGHGGGVEDKVKGGGRHGQLTVSVLPDYLEVVDTVSRALRSSHPSIMDGKATLGQLGLSGVSGGAARVSVESLSLKADGIHTQTDSSSLPSPPKLNMS